MKYYRTYLLFLVGIVLISCNEAHVSEVETERNEPASNTTYVPPQLRQIDTSAILNRIQFLEFSRLENGTSPQLEKEIQLLKDSIGDKSTSKKVGKQVKFGDFKKIPTH